MNSIRLTSPSSVILATVLAASLAVASTASPAPSVAQSTPAAEAAPLSLPAPPLEKPEIEVLQVKAPFPLGGAVAGELMTLAEASSSSNMPVRCEYLPNLGAFIVKGTATAAHKGATALKAALQELAASPQARGAFGDGRFDLDTKADLLSALLEHLRVKLGVNVVVTDEAALALPVPSLLMNAVDLTVVASVLDGIKQSDGATLTARAVWSQSNAAVKGQSTLVIGLTRSPREEPSMRTMFYPQTDGRTAERWADLVSVYAEIEGFTDLVKARYHEPSGTFFLRVPESVGDSIEMLLTDDLMSAEEGLDPKGEVR